MSILNCPAWLNGTFCEIKDLNFSILDLGLIHCDASYDVACSSNRKIFLLNEHIERFYTSCDGLRLPISISRDEAKSVIIELCQRSDTESLLIWMGITRGIPSSGNPRDLINTKPNLFFYVKPYYDFGKSDNPITLCLSKTIRTSDSSINQIYKNWSWIDLTSAQWEAMDRSFDSAVLLSDQGFITEGPGFAVWGIKDNKVLSPKKNCLPSVTIYALEKVCKSNNIQFEYRDISLDEFKNFDFVGIASTSGGIKPVSNFEEVHYKENLIYKKLKTLIKDMYHNEKFFIEY